MAQAKQENGGQPDADLARVERLQQPGAEALGILDRQPGRMEGEVTFLDCPAYFGTDGTTRCGLPAEVEARYGIESTDGPLESARIRCPQGHWFNGPIESLTIPQQPARADASASPSSHVTIQRSVDWSAP